MRSQSVAAIIILSCVAALGATVHASVSARKTTSPAVSNGNADVNSIKGAYKDRSYAFLTRSAGQVYSGSASDFILTDRGGARLSRTAAGQRASTAMSTLSRSIGMPSDPQALTYTIDIMSVTFSGNQAIVIESGQVHALSVSDASASAFASAAGVFSGVYRDVWVRTPQGWQQKSSRKF